PSLTRQHSFGRRLPRFLHLRSVGESPFRFRRKCFAKPVAQYCWKSSEVCALTQLPRKYALGVIFAERCVAGQREVHNRCQSEIVRSRSLRLAKELLGGRERGRARRACDILSRYVSNSEIGYAPAVITVNENVLWFEIAVQNSIRVRDDQPIQNLLDLRCNLDELARS